MSQVYIKLSGADFYEGSALRRSLDDIARGQGRGAFRPEEVAELLDRAFEQTRKEEGGQDFDRRGM